MQQQVTTHSSIVICSNGDILKFSVAPEYLEAHKQYNAKRRPHWAIIIDGKCIQRGKIADVVINKLEQDLKANPILHKPIGINVSRHDLV